jgi:membrane-associated phospholipid phosphatase
MSQAHTQQYDASTRQRVGPNRLGWRVRWIVAAVVLVIVAGFFGLDRYFYEEVSLRLETKDLPLDRDFYTVTKPFWLACRYTFAHAAGVAGMFVLISVVHKRRWRAGSVALAAILLAGLAANAMQAGVGRYRPNQADSALSFRPFLAEPFSTSKVSFPSGEAATALAMAYALGQFFPRERLAFNLLCGSAAVARLINGAHYLSDVLAGALVGVGCASVVFWYARRRWPNLLDDWQSPAPSGGQPLTSPD